MNELDLLAMDDFELFNAMNDAEKKYDALRDEFRRRNLHRTPYCEFSHQAPGIPNIPGLRDFLESKDE